MGYPIQDRKKFFGLDISVENKKGTVRSGVDPDGEPWQTFMHCDYGYILKTKGVDGDHVDCYLNDAPYREPSRKVFIVHQRRIEIVKDWVGGTCPECHNHVHSCFCPSSFDEDKVMLNFANRDEAEAAYDAQYNHSWFRGGISEYDIDDFKDFVLQTLHGKKALPIRAISTGETKVEHIPEPITEEPYENYRDQQKKEIDKFHSMVIRAVDDQKGPVRFITISELKEAGRRYAKDMIAANRSKPDKEWIGVDLDGTLAHYDNWNAGKIGKPVTVMLNRIIREMDRGKKFKIFTARASTPSLIPAVEEWLKENGLEGMEVTHEKDHLMTELWDDRAKQVKKNTGRFLLKATTSSLEALVRENLGDRCVDITEEERKKKMKKNLSRLLKRRNPRRMLLIHPEKITPSTT